MARNSDFVSEYRQTVSKLIDTMNELRALRRWYDALDLGNALVDGAEGDFAGANSVITKAQLVNAVAQAGTLDTEYDAIKSAFYTVQA